MTHSNVRSRRSIALLAAAATVIGVSGLAQAQAARDFISIVGSSTVYPFTTTVAEQLGRQGKFKTPKVESTGRDCAPAPECTGGRFTTESVPSATGTPASSISR